MEPVLPWRGSRYWLGVGEPAAALFRA